MQRRFTTRVRRSSDRRKDIIAGRAAGWSPIAQDPVPNEQASSEVPASTATASERALRVLVIDNDMRAADSLELLLHAGGYSETRVAYSAHGALAIAKEFCPAIVLMELDMRDIGSYELGLTLRERTRLQHVRLIAVTDNRVHGGRDNARHAGFERYLLKPITAADLSVCLADRSSTWP